MVDNLPQPSSPSQVLTKPELVWKLKEMGYSLSEIAAELNFANTEAVVTCLNEKYKQEAAWLTEDQRTMFLGIQMGRYESIIRGVAQSAQLGDPKSAEVMLKAMAEENKLMRMTDTQSTQTAQVLVVSGDEASYIA